ncbi:MAG: hypothetical protein O8C67_09455 [Candidatus Methanoperedens sp.]|nr:hypothetical protein [Candidatus Methanoperedens sp.]
MNTQSFNNCYYNVGRKCTHPTSTFQKIGDSGRNFDSKTNCTFTQDGAQSLCSWYFFEHDKNKKISIDCEQMNDLLKFLQGKFVPEGYILDNLPNLSKESSWTVIYMLQEWIGLIPDKFELCDNCGYIYDSEYGGCHIDDKDDLADKIEMGYRVTEEDIGKTFCDNCR